jgi:hypothetical protein
MAATPKSVKNTKKNLKYDFFFKNAKKKHLWDPKIFKKCAKCVKMRKNRKKLFFDRSKKLRFPIFIAKMFKMNRRKNIIVLIIFSTGKYVLRTVLKENCQISYISYKIIEFSRKKVEKIIIFFLRFTIFLYQKYKKSLKNL